MSYFQWRPYVSVAERRAQSWREMEKLRKKGFDIQPVQLEGRKIATSFWGKGWCDHLESFSDYANRLPRGRAYIRNGSVCHLEVKKGAIEAFVSGSAVYKVAIGIKPLAGKVWDGIKAKCRGQIGSALELLQGRLSGHVMGVVSDRAHGLFPQPGEMTLKCSCPDWAVMCKHVAAALYGVGSRLDRRPELLFVLRGVDAEELISADLALPAGAAIGAGEALVEGGLGEIFGIDIDAGTAPATEESKKRRKASAAPAAATKRKGKIAAVPEKPVLRRAPAKKAAAPKKSKPAFDPKAPTGKGIAQLRKMTGLSTADFARELGVSVPSAQRWENTPGIVRLYARPLAALTRLQEERLLDGPGGKRK